MVCLRLWLPPVPYVKLLLRVVPPTPRCDLPLTDFRPSFDCLSTGSLLSLVYSDAQGHTHTANPLSCAAASAVLEYIVAEDVVDGARRRGEYLQAQLEEKLGSSPIVGTYRQI